MVNGANDPADSGEQAGSVRLADCIALMQADLVHAGPDPQKLNHRVTDILMYDPLDEWTPVTGPHHFGRWARLRIGGICPAVGTGGRRGRCRRIVKAYGVPMERVRAAAARHGIGRAGCPRRL